MALADYIKNKPAIETDRLILKIISSRESLKYSKLIDDRRDERMLCVLHKYSQIHCNRSGGTAGMLPME